MFPMDGDLVGMNEQPGTKVKMLVVDDQPANIQVLYRLFADSYQIFMATSGEAAIATALKELPDIILLDVIMPGLDGYETCSRLKADAQTRDIPILFITAHQDPAEETKALEVGGGDYITKPINPAVVRTRVKTQVTLKRQTDLLKRMVFLDGLTGVFNRRYFDDRVNMEMRRSERDHTSLGLILLDVDHFKLYNDKYGHQAGDDCLRVVAQTLTQTIMRPADVVTRYGGEEFACILPGTDLEGARLVAERMCKSIQELALPHEASSTGPVVTISAGVAVKPIDHNCTVAELLGVADTMLYEAKTQGRARVCGGVLSGDQV
jgi:diguanylate cyclase (GGDEF)-like protein